jgi:hypothetical protein
MKQQAIQYVALDVPATEAKALITRQHSNECHAESFNRASRELRE